MTEEVAIHLAGATALIICFALMFVVLGLLDGWRSALVVYGIVAIVAVVVAGITVLSMWLWGVL